MSKQKFLVIVLSLVIAFSIAVPAARADVWNQKTELTFTEPVEIPGQVLPAGTYWFVLVNSGSNRNLVQIFAADWSVLCATVQTVPSERREPTSGTTLTFAERPYSQPQALLTWFYPGDTTGHEFIYSR